MFRRTTRLLCGLSFCFFIFPLELKVEDGPMQTVSGVVYSLGLQETEVMMGSPKNFMSLFFQRLWGGARSGVVNFQHKKTSL